MKKLFLFRFWKSWKHKHPDWSLGKAIFGFTLIEMLVVMAIVGVLAAIVGPTWLGSLNRQRLSQSQNQVFRAIKTAQSNAKRDKVDWRTSFRASPTDGTAQIAIHKDIVPLTGVTWEPVVSNVRLHTLGLTAIGSQPTTCSPACFLKFDAKGQPSGTLGKVTLAYGSQTGPRACVVISTLIGGMRTAFDTDCN
jgi:prepilin-type N-terminal cleavage/methylation domain-containing protein